MTARAPDTVSRGVSLMVVGVLYVPIMDAFTKYLTTDLPPIEVAFGRFIAQGLICLAFALAFGRLSELRPPQLPLHLLRGFFLAATAFLFITSLAYMPLPDALAIAFLEPLLLTALSPWLLGETIGWRRWLACSVGFVGCLFVVQPSFQNVGWVVLYPIGSALTFTGYHIMTRKIAGAGTVLGAQWTTSIFGAASLMVPIIPLTMMQVPGYALVLPGGMNLALIGVVGFISFTSHWLIIKAFQMAPAGVLAPYGYLEIVTATILSYVIWNELPGLLSSIGIALIIGAGIYSAHREMVRTATVERIPHE